MVCTNNGWSVLIGCQQIEYRKVINIKCNPKQNNFFYINRLNIYMIYTLFPRTAETPFSSSGVG